MTLNQIFSTILIIGALGGSLALMIVRKIHASNPEYLEKQRERESEARRRLKEEKELDNMINTDENKTEE